MNEFSSRNLKNYKVDVVIPIYGHEDLLEKCVDSVLRTTDSKDTHIILVDDYSPGLRVRKLLFEKYEKVINIDVIYSSENKGFIQTTKRGAEEGIAPYILFLNSDTEATEYNWIEKLIPEEKEVAVVGTKLLFPTNYPKIYANRVQHAGVGIIRIKDKVNINHMFYGYEADRYQVNLKRSLNAVTGACFLVRRSVWEELGGWDDNFNKGVYEDVDFCWRAYSKGYVIFYNPSTFLYHHQSASTSPDGSHNLNIHTRENAQRLMEKWKDNFIFANIEEFYGKNSALKWERASEVLEETVALAKENKFDVACKKIENSIVDFPEFSNSYFIYAKILSKLGCRNDAIHQLQNTLYYDPFHWESRFRLIYELIKTDNIDLARYYFNMVEPAFPNHESIKDLRGMLAKYIF
jgi:GT2 family glycosyltransferase